MNETAKRSIDFWIAKKQRKYGQTFIGLKITYWGKNFGESLVKKSDKQCRDDKWSDNEELNLLAGFLIVHCLIIKSYSGKCNWC